MVLLYVLPWPAMPFSPPPSFYLSFLISFLLTRVPPSDLSSMSFHVLSFFLSSTLLFRLFRPGVIPFNSLPSSTAFPLLIFFRCHFMSFLSVFLSSTLPFRLFRPVILPLIPVLHSIAILISVFRVFFILHTICHCVAISD
jgi:hypothetical protein